MLKWGLSGRGSNLLKSDRPLTSTTPWWILPKYYINKPLPAAPPTCPLAWPRPQPTVARQSLSKLGGGLFRLRPASTGVMLRGPLAGRWLAVTTVRSPPTLSASRTRLGFFAVSLRRKPRRFCMLTIAESTLTSARLKSPGRPHGGEIGPRSASLGSCRCRRRSSFCGARAAKALPSSPEGSPKQAGGLLERWAAAWAAASQGTLSLPRCSRRQAGSPGASRAPSRRLGATGRVRPERVCKGV